MKPGICNLLIFVLLVAAASANISANESGVSPPNIILINLDDADYRMFSPDLLKLYPNIQRLADKSISFTNLHVTTPFCGPSRASLFRGQYAHRTGVRVNIPESPLSLGFKGGYREFLRQGHEQAELGVWMKQAGYRTMHIGKFHHNGFDFKKPPGWDDFYMSNGGRYQGTYRFTTKDNPLGGNSQNAADVYRTDQETDDAVRLIREHTQQNSDGDSSRRTAAGSTNSKPKPQPFFLYVAPLAPHRPVGRDFTKMVDDKKYADWQPDLRIPLSPEFDESQMSDKPLHRQSPPYSPEEISVLQSEYLCRARAVKSVDDMVGRIMDTISECNLTDSTYVFFTSDNGYQLGQHRLHNKLDPYQMCTNVPLLVSGPAIAPNQTANHLLAHIDICATILELGNAKVPEFLDSKSFVKLLKNPQAHDQRSWRKSVVIENWQAKRNRGKVLPGVYSGLRLYDEVYVEWITGDKEYYDLNADPFELENSFYDLSANRKSALKEMLRSARNVKMNPLVTIIPGVVETRHLESPNFIRGYAEDDQKVEKVLLAIQHTETKSYWNGNDWQKNLVQLGTQLSAVDQQVVDWKYELPADLKDQKPKLLATAIAVDGEQNQSAAFSVTLTKK